MKIKIEIDFDRREQEEVSIEAQLDHFQVKKIMHGSQGTVDLLEKN